VSSPARPASSAAFHRSLTKSYPVAAKGNGVYLEDSTGKRYIDLSGSAAVNFIGHGVQQVWEAVAQQTRQLEFAHTSQFTTDIAERFAAELLDFVGPGFSGGAVFFTAGGSEATETALKLARQYQVESGHSERFRIVSRQQSYHGATLGAMAASGNKRRRDVYAPMLRDEDLFIHIGMPFCYRCAFDCSDGCAMCGAQYADELASAIEKSGSSVAAFIAEPVSGATLGAVTPPPGYFERIADICKREEIVFIADEVMTGMGRCGTNLASHVWKGSTAPDILVLAKGLTSGYLPLGAVVATAKIVHALRSKSGSFIHGFTYNAHPACAAAGKAVLDIIKRDSLVARAKQLEPIMRRELSRLLELECVGDVRGIGLLWGAEFVRNKHSKEAFPAAFNFSAKVATECSARGVLVYPMQGTVDGYSGDHLLIAPPAIITEQQIGECAKVLSASIKTVSETFQKSQSGNHK
jgi:adenosylmethionine-8-amino-7-oxononanoate aminotransferase